jgi:hypothetical protein
VNPPNNISNDVNYSPRFGLDLKDIEAICAAIQQNNPSWRKPRRSLGLLPKDWTPNLISSDGRACHIHVIEELGEHWIQRIKLAKAAKKGVVIAAPLSCWHFNETLIAADELDIEPILVVEDGNEWRVQAYKSIARLIAHQKLILKPDSLKLLGIRLLERARKARGANPRGRLFEDFLAFLFSQIVDFEVFEQNYNTETEEIDIVLKNRQTNGRAWPSNAPLVLVSGKNKTQSVGATAVTSLESKVDKRRGMCRLGFLCASGSISRDAYTHELRYSTGQNVLTLIDGKSLDKLLSNPDKLTSELEALVIRASLR